MRGAGWAAERRRFGGRRQREIVRPVKLKEWFERCATSFKEWGLSTFGRIPRKIKELQTKMAKLNNYQMSVGLVQLSREKEKELDRFYLALEEYDWWRLARNEWLVGGRHNTTFFHAKASSRWNKKWNKKDWKLFGAMAKGGGGGGHRWNWEVLKELFSTSNNHVWRIWWEFPNPLTLISHQSIRWIGSSFSMDDVRDAIFSMGRTNYMGQIILPKELGYSGNECGDSVFGDPQWWAVHWGP